MAKVAIEVHTKCTVWQVAKFFIEESEIESLRDIVKESLGGDDNQLIDVLDNLNAEYDMDLDTVEDLPTAENDNQPTVFLRRDGIYIAANGADDE